MFCVTKSYLQHLSIILHAVSKNNMWASHGLDRFCVRPYSVIGPELQVRAKAVNYIYIYIWNDNIQSFDSSSFPGPLGRTRPP